MSCPLGYLMKVTDESRYLNSFECILSDFVIDKTKLIILKLFDIWNWNIA